MKWKSLIITTHTAVADGHHPWGIFTDQLAGTTTTGGDNRPAEENAGSDSIKHTFLAFWIEECRHPALVVLASAADTVETVKLERISDDCGHGAQTGKIVRIVWKLVLVKYSLQRTSRVCTQESIERLYCVYPV